MLQDETKLFARPHFERQREVRAHTASIQNMHRLFPADRFPQLINKLTPNAIDGTVLV